jgi:hypothetical protein
MVTRMKMMMRMMTSWSGLQVWHVIHQSTTTWKLMRTWSLIRVILSVKFSLLSIQFNSFLFLLILHAELSMQIRASPQAKVFFATMCQEEGLKPLELIKWIRIRWGSMYDLVDRVLLNRVVSIT